MVGDYKKWTKLVDKQGEPIREGFYELHGLLYTFPVEQGGREVWLIEDEGKRPRPLTRDTASIMARLHPDDEVEVVNRTIDRNEDYAAWLRLRLNDLEEVRRTYT